MQDTGCMMQDRNGSDSAYLVPGTWYPAPEPVRRRGPNTEHRGPSPATRKRAHRGCILHIPCAGFSKAGTRHRSRSDAEDRTPSTEDRARPPENAHIGFASCIPSVRVFRRQVLVPGSRSRYRHLGPDTRTGSTLRAGYRAPRTEPENAHIGYASWILHPLEL